MSDMAAAAVTVHEAGCVKRAAWGIDITEAKVNNRDRQAGVAAGSANDLHKSSRFHLFKILPK